MNRFHVLLLAVIAFPVTPSAVAADPVPPTNLLRLGIVDDSTSMSGERIATVRDEWLKLARQLPPSPENPIVLITFGSIAEAPRTFIDLPTFESAIGQLNGTSEGTYIAGGLREGIAYLKSQPRAKDVWVFLYSDGEDSNQAEILDAEQELDSIFADRQQQGLSQTVFLKRWGNTNAELLSLIESRGRAKVLDAGDLSVRPITFDPQVELVQVGWNPDDPLKLDVEYAPRLDVRGDTDDLDLPTLRLVVEVDGATGDRDVEVLSGGVPVTRKVTLPISSEARRAGKLSVPFVINPPVDIAAENVKVLPFVAATRIDLPIDLPEDRYQYHLIVSTTPKVGTWNDTLAKRFRTPLQVTFDVTCREGDNESPGEVEFVPTVGTVVISGPPAVRLPASGTVTVDLVIETAVANPTEPPSNWRSPFEITSRPIRTRPHAIFDPPELSITGDAPIPPPLLTPISARVLRVSAAEWVDLAQGTARFQVETEFDVQGSIAPNSQISLVTTGSVTSMQISPAMLQKGIQRVTLDVTAVVPPGPMTQMLESQIVPPTSDGIIQYQAGPRIQYTVTGPNPLQLGIASRGRPVQALRAVIADNEHEARVQLEPIIVGMKSTPSLSGLAVRLVGQNEPLKFDNAGSCQVFRRCQLVVPVSVSQSRSFFRDTVLGGSLDVEPLLTNNALEGRSFPLIVVVEAPFKRLLWQLALPLLSVLAAVVIARLYLTLRRTD